MRFRLQCWVESLKTRLGIAAGDLEAELPICTALTAAGLPAAARRHLQPRRQPSRQGHLQHMPSELPCPQPAGITAPVAPTQPALCSLASCPASRRWPPAAPPARHLQAPAKSTAQVRAQICEELSTGNASVGSSYNDCSHGRIQLIVPPTCTPPNTENDLSPVYLFRLGFKIPFLPSITSRGAGAEVGALSRGFKLSRLHAGDGVASGTSVEWSLPAVRPNSIMNPATKIHAGLQAGAGFKRQL